jgi:hypothetical protein
VKKNRIRLSAVKRVSSNFVLVAENSRHNSSTPVFHTCFPGLPPHNIIIIIIHSFFFLHHLHLFIDHIISYLPLASAALPLPHRQ